MKSFIEYMEFREAEDAVYNTVRDTYRKYSGWKLRKADQGNLNTQAIASLQAVIDYMKKSDDPKIKGLYNGGYAGELYTLSQWFQGKEDPRVAQDRQDRQDTQDTQEEGFVGGAVGAAAGLAMGGIPGAVWGGIAGHYGQKVWNFARGPMRELNKLENQAMKALQAVVNRLNYEKGEEYHSGFAATLQGWITRMKEMQQFNNQPRKSEIDPHKSVAQRLAPGKEKDYASIISVIDRLGGQGVGSTQILNGMGFNSGFRNRLEEVLAKMVEEGVLKAVTAKGATVYAPGPNYDKY